ncbi:MAG: T9SS type A sorting domain-containing protein [Bacteroidetes bacterium]|nr:T9SS type A sorting domain-containing protein [Bacteroidota bacterium]MBX7129813.1 T9SS type A sorting domain-containing protein [Flavobacteriales bacterium]MCC6655375.1 T9SS type A sorting domain-containing protein [Flavobacteriales bacterium]HMU14172.1 T9SS type A sorting domain-containing protein [Flavobacteriales bacterium]HMW96956.1 T9SS type A sorting domain-containing protein [Flavobacteriales bacterium]
MRPLLLTSLLLICGTVLAQAGSLDASFNPTDPSGGASHGLNGGCQALVVQPDGGILVGGSFTMVNGVERPHIARLNPNGSLDPSFAPGYGANDNVTAIALQSDGKILIGGAFTYYNGIWCNHLVRLHADGSVDSSFNTGLGFDGNVYALLVQPDNKILVGGDYFHLDNQVAQGLVRLETNGARDTGFDAGGVPIVYALALRPNGRIIVGGNFSFVQGVERRCIAALLPSGQLDPSFAPFGWNFSPVLGLDIQPDGRVLAVGMMPGCIARLELNGDMDPLLGSGTGGFTGGPGVRVFGVDVDDQGRITCVGFFGAYNGVSRKGMTRLNPDGTLDESFSIGEGFNAEVYALAVQPDGRYMVGGWFQEVDGTPRNRIARIMDQEVSTIGIVEHTSPTLELYPNPSSGQFFIGGITEGGATRVTIIAPDGRLVEHVSLTPMSGGPLSVDLGSEAPGVYTVRTVRDGLVHTGRVVLQ